MLECMSSLPGHVGLDLISGVLECAWLLCDFRCLLYEFMRGVRCCGGAVFWSCCGPAWGWGGVGVGVGVELVSDALHRAHLFIGKKRSPVFPIIPRLN